MSNEPDVPRVAIQSHMDGDPKPRPKEINKWDAIRREHGLEEMLVMILLPDETVTDGLFPGYALHGWSIRDDAQGKTICEPKDIDVQVIPDE